MATIVYLDAEDEITSAAARIRAAADSRVGLVVPFGSRVATSRINFKLLAREAMAKGRRLDIVAPDASARALAASAGLPVFTSVGEYEAALDVEDDEKAARRAASLAAATGIAADTTVAATSPAAEPIDAARAAAPVSARPAGADAATEPYRGAHPDSASIGAAAVATGSSASIPVARPHRRRRTGLLVGSLLVLIVVGAVAAAGAYLVLPAAAITVTPHIATIGPITFDVRADPSATAVDLDAGVIPAQTLTIPVDAQSEFQATGKRIERTAATGDVKWTNCDPTAAYSIPSGTIVATRGGVQFKTDEALFLPVATLIGGGATPKLNCQSSSVGVTAVVAGPAGNVPAATIRVVPARYNRTVLRVTNPAPTSGGKREEFTRVSQKDLDAAVAQLGKDLQSKFETEVTNPARVPPGTTVFPGTASLADPVPTVDPQTLLGQEVDSFTLGASADGTVLAVDSSPAKAIADERLKGSISQGYDLVDGSTSVKVGDGKVAGGSVTFPVRATAKQRRPLDAAALRASVLGLSQADAQRTLAPYGDVSISFWPGWVSSVPTLDQRVTLDVASPVEDQPSPGASPASGSVPSAG